MPIPVTPRINKIYLDAQGGGEEEVEGLMISVFMKNNERFSRAGRRYRSLGIDPAHPRGDFREAGGGTRAGKYSTQSRL